MSIDECLECGCNAYNVVRKTSSWGRQSQIVACDHCGNEWTRPDDDPAATNKVADDDDGPVYRTVRVRCPECNAPNPPVTSTRNRIRLHKCRECDHCFKSREEAA